MRKKILKQTDAEIIEIDAQIDDEIDKGILPDPNIPVDDMGNPLPADDGIIPEEDPEAAIEQGAGGEVPIEPKGGKNINSSIFIILTNGRDY